MEQGGENDTDAEDGGEREQMIDHITDYRASVIPDNGFVFHSFSNDTYIPCSQSMCREKNEKLGFDILVDGGNRPWT
jgi:hypothetical protein